MKYYLIEVSIRKSYEAPTNEERLCMVETDIEPYFLVNTVARIFFQEDCKWSKLYENWYYPELDLYTSSDAFRELSESEYLIHSKEIIKFGVSESQIKATKRIMLSQVFQPGRVYRLNAENRQEYDEMEGLNGELHTGYHYAKARSYAAPNQYVADCWIVNEDGFVHPFLSGGGVPLRIDDLEFEEKG